MCRRTIRAALLSAASLAALGLSPACAQSWQGTTSDWGTPTNWSSGAVPTAAGTVNIGSAGAVNPSINGIAASANILRIGAAGSTPLLSLTNGGSLAAYSTTFGQSVGEAGSMQVTGPSTQWTGNFLDLGRYGSGTLTVSGGAAVTFNDTVMSAVFAGSTGTMTISGAGTSFYTGNTHIIGNGGDGSLAILAGARADDKGVTLGQNAGSRGTATVDGSGSAWNIRAALSVGAQGNGTLGISNGGQVTAAGAVYVGRETTSIGSLTLDGAGSRLVSGGSFIVGNRGRGSATISGGAVSQAQSGIIGYYDNSPGELRVTGANSLWQGSTYLMVGHEGDGTATLDNGGTVRVNGGAGQIIIANRGTSSSTVNIGAAAGAPAQAPGFIEAGSIRFGLGNGTLFFNHTSDNYVVNAAISGKGDLITESGTTILRGINTYTGATEVRGGTLIVDGAITASSVEVGEHGTLGGSGTVSSLTMNGVISPGNSPGTLTVSGNLTLGVGTTYIAEVEGPVADRINVTGSASLAGTLQLVSLGGASRFTTPYTLLSAPGGVSGTFNTVVPNFGAAVGTSVTYTPTAVLLALAPRPLAPLAGSTRNGLAIAAGIDQAVAAGGDPSSLFQIYNQPAAAIPAALNQLSGEVHTAAPAMANVAADQFLRAMLDPMAAGRLGMGAPGPGAAAFSGLVRKGADAPAAPSRLDAPVYSVWGSAFGSHGRTDGDVAVGSSRRTIDDTHLATGIDMRLMPGTVAGLAVSGGKSRAALPGFIGKVDANVFQAGLYGTTQIGAIKLGAATSYAWLDNDASRGVPVLGSSLASSYTSTAWSGRLQASATAFSLNGISLSPLAALQATHTRSPAVVETNWAGANAGALVVAKHSETTSRGELGLQLDADGVFGQMPVTGYVRAAWAHYFQRDAELAASFVGLPGAVFGATGAEASRNSALVSAGISARLSERITLGLNLDGELSGNGNRLGGTAQFRVSF